MLLEKAVAENAWQIEEGLYRILLPLPFAVPFVNAYVLESRGEYLLLDVGANWEPGLRALGRALKAIGVPYRGLKYLVLSHRHLDHSGGAAPVHERWGGTVLAHPGEELPLMGSEEVISWAVQNGAPLEAVRQWNLERSGPRQERMPSQWEPLAHGQVIALGDLRLQVLEAPGHSPAQVMLYEPKRGWLLCADQVLSVLAPNVWHNPNTPGDPLGSYLDGLARLKRFSCRLTLPGHGLPFYGTPAELAARMEAFHLRLARQVQRAVEAGATTAYDVVRHLWPDVTQGKPGLRSRMAEALACLVYLERQGAIRCGPTNGPDALQTWEPAGRS